MLNITPRRLAKKLKCIADRRKIRLIIIRVPACRLALLNDEALKRIKRY
jgi:hypothetical protein